MHFPIVKPDWSEYPWAFAFTTIAYEGDSVYDFNGNHKNNLRALLSDSLNIPQTKWITLNHGNNIVTFPGDGKFAFNPNGYADAGIIFTEVNSVAITTADCLPVVLLSPQAHSIAVVHCGWKGVANGILEDVMQNISSQECFSVDDMKVWIGPSVRDDYEIRQDVRGQLLVNKHITESNFVQIGEDKYLANLVDMAAQQLASFGIGQEQIEISPASTIADNRFFSVRREGFDTGRIATVVGILE